MLLLPAVIIPASGPSEAQVQRPGHTPVILHSDRGYQFTSKKYQQFLTAAPGGHR